MENHFSPHLNTVYYMPEYFPYPPDYIITHEEVLGSPVLRTALLTLTMLSSWRSSPQWWLVCNRASVGQVYNCIAR